MASSDGRCVLTVGQGSQAEIPLHGAEVAIIVQKRVLASNAERADDELDGFADRDALAMASCTGTREEVS